MAHPAIRNDTPFAFMPLFAADEDGRPLVVPLVRATYEIRANSASLQLSEEQREPKLAGELWFESEESSYKYEPETVFFKPATDVVLIGHAHAPNPQATHVDVGLKVGPVQKVARVFGDRYWVKQGGQVITSRPQPFERIPLVFERAFGGWDKADKDPDAWTFDQRNPVGRGYGDVLRFVEQGKTLLPNIEDPANPIRRCGDVVPPVGFGFVSPNWQARAQYAGTYDAAWDKQRKPLLPKDFDRRFFNAAAPGLVAPGYLAGNEDVVVINASRAPKLNFRLPSVPPPLCSVELRSGEVLDLQTSLDTVIVNTDDEIVELHWRAHARVRNGPHDVVAIDVGTGERVSGSAVN